MSTRITHRKKTDPSLPETSAWYQDLLKLQDQDTLPAGTRATTRLGHRARNGLQLAIITLLLALLVMDRLNYLRNLIPWPVLADEPQATANMKVPMSF